MSKIPCKVDEHGYNTTEEKIGKWNGEDLYGVQFDSGDITTYSDSDLRRIFYTMFGNNAKAMIDFEGYAIVTQSSGGTYVEQKTTFGACMGYAYNSGTFSPTWGFFGGVPAGTDQCQLAIFTTTTMNISKVRFIGYAKYIKN